MKPQLKEVETALTSVHESLRDAPFDACDQTDIEELIERVERELDTPAPNRKNIGTFLNSLARSIRSLPNRDQVCARIDAALHTVGVAPTWMA